MVGQSIKKRQDLVCFSHLRWGFVFQRPQHLMARFARNRRVFFIEEPVREDLESSGMRVARDEAHKVTVVTPLLPHGMGHEESCRTIGRLLRQFFRQKKIESYVAWFYTPMALETCGKLNPAAVVYDCMDELSLFKHAPHDITAREQTLLEMCDLVFTGGVSLFEAKRHQHARVYPFPSGVDCAHFAKARTLGADAAEGQGHLPRPRIGYAGVIDERIDLSLIAKIAEARPDWQIVMIGPVVKIDPETLPRRANIHWLGKREYADLPLYFAGWDVAMMPFALNDSTRYISPTKTPEYLAAGLPVVSTPVRDVVRGFGEAGLVRIAASPEEFLAATDRALTYGMGLKWRARADAFLKTLSWDETWKCMNDLVEGVLLPAKKASEPITLAAASGSEAAIA